MTLAYTDGKRVKTSENKTRPRICNRAASKNSVQRMSSGITTGQEVIVLSQEAKQKMLRDALQGAHNPFRGILKTGSDQGGKEIVLSNKRMDHEGSSPANKSRFKLFNIRDALSNPSNPTSSGQPSDLNISQARMIMARHSSGVTNGRQYSASQHSRKKSIKQGRHHPPINPNRKPMQAVQALPLEQNFAVLSKQ